MKANRERLEKEKAERAEREKKKEALQEAQKELIQEEEKAQHESLAETLASQATGTESESDPIESFRIEFTGKRSGTFRLRPVYAERRHHVHKTINASRSESGKETTWQT